MSLLNLSKSFTKLARDHAFTLTVISSLSGGGFAWMMATFALANDLERVEKKTDYSIKEHRMKDLRYHIDNLSKIPESSMPAETKRVLESYKLEYNHLLIKED